jgi:6,7-dimethyl-8-ribityllumazine synthase
VSAKVPKRLGVVIGEFHDQLMNDCLEDARLAAVSMGAEITQVLAIATASCQGRAQQWERFSGQKTDVGP